MKIQNECIPCLLKRVIFETEHNTKDPEVKKRVISNACRVFSEAYDPNECSAVIATKVHKITYETLEDDDPYKDLKSQSNKVALSLLPRVEELVKNSNDPLKTSMICAIVGNTLDFGIDGGSSHPDVLYDTFEKNVSDGLGYDDSEKVKNILNNAKNVVLFTDNCGEIVFDKILCRELKRQYPNIFLTLVVRGEPILSDATIEDVEELQMEEVVDEVLTTGCYAVGVDFNNLPDTLKKRLDESDLVICKGMANYESFSETSYLPVVYLLRIKCRAIADSMNLPLNISAIKIYE